MELGPDKKRSEFKGAFVDPNLGVGSPAGLPLRAIKVSVTPGYRGSVSLESIIGADCRWGCLCALPSHVGAQYTAALAFVSLALVALK